MIRKIGGFQSPLFKREKSPPPAAASLAVLGYFFGALGVHEIDPGYLLMAWMLAGLMALTIYYTVLGKGSLLNPYTMFFAAASMVCIAGYFAS